jgi:hypothetical protein
MFAIPGIVLLLIQGYTRPQEFFPALQSVPFLYVFFALALFGMFIDLRLRKIQPIVAPQLPWAIAWFGWSLVTLALRQASEVPHYLVEMGIPFVYLFLVAHTVQSFAGFRRVAGTVLAICLYLAFVGVHQGQAPRGCFQIDPSRSDMSGTWDGRYCESVETDCRNGDADPEATYICEHIGLFGTSSVTDRVRYRGSLNDPNELSLTLGIALPFAFAFAARKRTFLRILVLVAAIVLIGVCTVMTKSRGGQLVFLAVLGTYFVRRYGLLAGAVIGALFAVPVMLLGGRGGEEAEASSLERIECMYAAIMMFRQFPLYGVGLGQILEYHPLTAHNSYALAAAEMGFPGLFLFACILYLSFKIVIVAMQRYKDRPEATVANIWALALLASLIGLCVGIFFLSFCYHIILWIEIGLVGAFFQACRAHDPELDVRLEWRDLVYIFFGSWFMAALIYFYTSRKMGGG